MYMIIFYNTWGILEIDEGSAIILDYLSSNQRKLCYLALVVTTFLICYAFYAKYKPNAYEIKMNDEYTFYIKNKEEFEMDLINLQDELNKTFKDFKFKDKFTWNKVHIANEDITTKAEIKNIILGVSKSDFVKIEEKKSNSNTSNKAVIGKKTKLLRPNDGKVSSDFGMRWGKMHKGIDIANNTGAPIYAAMDGKISYAGWMEGYGNVIKIDHGNNLETIYAHCNLIRVKLGNEVKKGEYIGDVGSTGKSTGPHVHFEIRVNGTPQNPNNYI